MARAPSTFRQQDVTKAVKAVTAAGVHIARIEVDPSGRIVIITAAAETEREICTPLDAWMAKHGAHQA
jgi:hypothetical protein